MKIGFDAKRAFNNSRGLGNYSRDTIRIVSSLYPENEYVLFTPKKDSSIGFDYPESAKVISPNKVSIKSLWRTFGITKEAEKEGLGIYHGLSHELPVGIEKTNIHTAVTMHDLIFMKHPELYSSWDRWMYKKKYLRSCEIADCIVAISERTKEDLIEMAGVDASKIEVIYQGCSPIYHSEVTEEQIKVIKERYKLPEQYILSVGAIEPRKNHKLVLEALTSGHIDIPFVIVGRGTSYQEQVTALIHEHGLEDRVFVINEVKAGDLPILYHGASLFVFPSLYEGFGIPVIEALSCGVPVIASTGSCLEEAGGPDSCYVSPTDASELAYQIQRLLDDETLRSEMAASGLQYVQQFSDSVIGKKLMTTYHNIL